MGLASGSPSRRRSGGTVTSITGPMAPITTDQKKAGRSRLAHRQYRRGPAQKRGVDADIVFFVLYFAFVWRDGLVS